MADLFPALALGDCLDEAQAVVLPFKAAAAITKGQLVEVTVHVSGELGKITVAGTDSKVTGVALKSAAVGDVIPVVVLGVVKVTAGGAITVGSPVRAVTDGKIIVAVTSVTIPSGNIAVTSTSAQPSITVQSGVACGIALQTFADTDTGLILLK